jgi:hypothetical protein
METIIDNINLQLKSLDRQDNRLLMREIRNYAPRTKKELAKMLLCTGYHLNPILSRIYILYNKVNISDDDIITHWKYYYNMQYALHSSLHTMPKNPRQDNKAYVNSGSNGSNRTKIRYPKLCRKTAWKRFYKLFPKLNPINKSIR